LIVYVGSADALISPMASLAYYRRAARRMGGLAATRSFARLFAVPGMQHCQGGLAPASFGQAWVAPGLRPDPRHDVRAALEAWVEQGRAPDALVAAKYADDRIGGEVTATRELRAYPGVAGPIRGKQR
jgi:feruloyl esterase